MALTERCPAVSSDEYIPSGAVSASAPGMQFVTWSVTSRALVKLAASSGLHKTPTFRHQWGATFPLYFTSFLIFFYFSLLLFSTCSFLFPSSRTTLQHIWGLKIAAASPAYGQQKCATFGRSERQCMRNGIATPTDLDVVGVY